MSYRVVKKNPKTSPKQTDGELIFRSIHSKWKKKYVNDVKTMIGVIDANNLLETIVFPLLPCNDKSIC